MMLDFIKGKIVELNPTSVVLETGNLGYLLAISLNTYSSLCKDKSCKLYIYEAIREDLYQLFGFIDKRERQLFLHLISVSGVGANTARMVLSSLSVYELEGIITSGNSLALKTVRGIGSKTAERIMIDLKDKIKTVGISSENNCSTITVCSQAAQEAISALVMLGFNQSAAQRAVYKITRNHSDQTVEQIIKQALKIL